MGRNRVLWLGGGATAGKTTISNRLSDDYGYEIYNCDAKVSGRLAESKPGSAAHVFQRGLESEDALCDFFDQTIDEMAAAYMKWGQEEIELILKEAETASEDSAIVVDGAFELAPNLLKGRIDSNYGNNRRLDFVAAWRFVPEIGA